MWGIDFVYEEGYETIKAATIGLDTAPIHVGCAKNKSSFMATHKHDGFVEFYYIVQGNLKHYINGAVKDVNSPALIFVDDGDVHHLETSGSVTMYLVMVHNSAYEQMWQYLAPKAAETISDEFRLRPGVKLSAGRAMLLDHCFRDYFAKVDRQSAVDDVGARLILTRLAGMMLDVQKDRAPMTEVNRSMKVPGWFEELCINAVEKKLYLDGIEGLVTWSGKSNAYLGKCFRQYMDLTPSAYVNFHRLEYAKELLVYSDTPVIDICMESGFGNLSHFYHLFKERFGISPSKYRTRHRTEFMI